MAARWTCAYCDGAAHDGEHVAREAMFGLDGRFAYRTCSACGSWTIVAVPDDLARYYPAGYQSLGSADDPPLKRCLKRRRFEASRGARDPIGRLLLALLGTPNVAAWLAPLALGRDSAILDAGSGNGGLLAQLRDVGFRQLTGVDPFLAPGAARAGIRLVRGEIDQVDGRYDLVMFHHSLEHTRDPARALAAAAARLADGGRVLVRIPLVGSEAQRRYGVNWSQLDAPRHLALPTLQGMQALAGRCALAVDRVEFDSTGFQFWASELIAAGGTLMDDRAFNPQAPSARYSAAELVRFEVRARAANAAGTGDQAGFYLRRAAGTDGAGPSRPHTPSATARTT